MCGIAGVLVTSGAAGAWDPAATVARMIDALSHRGPDGRGVVPCQQPGPDSRTGSSVVLGHARLAIIDLSERGAQPMRAAHTPMWITFNGEIYNFREIRGELQARGRRFASDTDTEVILQGYEEWGEAIIDRLQGMFAFALWDGRRGRLILARDRMGIKPLYLYRRDGLVLFASEVRALLASGLVPRRLDQIGLEQYLAYQTVPPPRTLVEGVTLMLPGHAASVGGNDGRIAQRRYWDLLTHASAEAAGANPAQARSAVGELLERSAALHLVSDVPVGIFLSGGIDSSAIVALTRRAGITPRTFSVVLPGAVQDESSFARQVARHFGAEHTEIAIGETESRAALPAALAQVDHPSGDGVNTYLVSRAVRAAGYKVALSGLGGDELFGGYPSFKRLKRFAVYAKTWRRSPAPVRAAAVAAVRAFGGSSIATSKMAAVLESDGSMPHTFPLMRQMFSADMRRVLLGDALVDQSAELGDPYVALLREAVKAHPDAEVMTLVSYAEALTYMHDVLLRDTDQMSMAHGLEARVPLLDHRLAEYVMGLSERAKAPSGVPKRLLVESLGEPLPASAAKRPKQGFVLPFDRWMKGDLRGFCEQQLGPAGLSGRGVVSESAVQSLWKAFLAGDRRTSWSRPWTLVALNAWLDQNRIEGR
jgi:asparagine synthase (glutamine-hydrolysing)